MSEPKADAPNLSIWTVVLASSAGTVIEWYDFYLYGSLAVFFSTLFYPANDPTAAVLISVATFATGFVIRPFGAILVRQSWRPIGTQAHVSADTYLNGDFDHRGRPFADI
ncbi:hypothetical protein ACVWZK_000417 [Bradyrhizobium sp. GM0.4]